MPTPVILAIESASKYCSVALSQPDGSVLQELHLGQRAHTRQLLPMVDKLLSDTGLGKDQIDAVAYGKGPGSFTGVRIGVSFAQGLAIGWQKPLLAVSSLEALAMQAVTTLSIVDDTQLIAAFDARMGEAYAASYLYCNNRLVVQTPPSLCRVQDWNIDGLLSDSKPFVLIGSAFEFLPQMNLSLDPVNVSPGIEPVASSLLKLSIPQFSNKKFTEIHSPEISYLRDNIVQS